MWIKTGFILLTNGLPLLTTLLYICVDLRGMTQVVANDGIDIGQMERRILPDDFFGGSAIGKGSNHRIERDARVPPTRMTPWASTARGMTSVVGERTIGCTSNFAIVGEQGREVHFSWLCLGKPEAQGRLTLAVS